MNESEAKKSVRAEIQLESNRQPSSLNLYIADIKIRNNSDKAIRDISVICTTFGKSGTELESFDQTVYIEVPAQSSETEKRVNFGYINSQADNIGCLLLDFVLIE
ncbi:MAG: hypothetical protein LH472_02100 [Pyrinomonadaceae bacterium]|nr:hypothetical protein [Pyrinomonadaceae bacterium]